LKKLRSDPEALLGLVLRWRDHATKAGGRIKRIVLAFEAGRDGFWLARWLRARGIEAYVIHPASIPVSREHRRAKTDRLDAGLLMRALLGWLRGEPKHCSMAAIPTVAEEDGRRPTRERETLVRANPRGEPNQVGADPIWYSHLSERFIFLDTNIWPSVGKRKAALELGSRA
jgi:transposase